MFVELEKAIGLAGVCLPFNINLTKDHRKLLYLLSDEISRVRSAAKGGRARLSSLCV